jgi:perosamine synthetase
MMLPIVAHKMSFRDLMLSLFKGEGPAGNLFLLLPRNVIFIDSGRSACYEILEFLKQKSSRENEVIVPAYTANALIEAIRRSGLKPVLCDMALDLFNTDVAAVLDRVTDRTLAVIGVHMFGLPMRDIVLLKERLPWRVFLIEDCAQALGTMMEGVYVGKSGDASFFSFNRGKNLPAYGGGCMATDSEPLGEALKKSVGRLEAPSYLDDLKIFLKLSCLLVAVHRFFYGLIFPFFTATKEKPALATHSFDSRKCSLLQQRFAVVLSREFEEACQKRFQNACRLREGLKACAGVRIPEFSDKDRPALNRFPVVFDDLGVKEKVRMRLRLSGIEASAFYIKPLHHIFDLGYAKEAFPNAVYLAEHLLTLPVHPLVEVRDIEIMVDIIRKVTQKIEDRG